jgi:hypothetical protein
MSNITLKQILVTESTPHLNYKFLHGALPTYTKLMMFRQKTIVDKLLSIGRNLFYTLFYHLDHVFKLRQGVLVLGEPDKISINGFWHQNLYNFKTIFSILPVFANHRYTGIYESERKWVLHVFIAFYWTILNTFEIYPAKKTDTIQNFILMASKRFKKVKNSIWYVIDFNAHVVQNMQLLPPRNNWRNPNINIIAVFEISRFSTFLTGTIWSPN